MKTIRIKDLHLQNFKGAKAVSVTFGESETAISGRNATGKTTIMDAFLWLLWGVNSQNQPVQKFGIKPYSETGEVQNDLNTEVTGTFDVIDTDTAEVQSIQLRRRWVSQWRTRKGETEREFKGNKGEYFVNDVPVTEAEYNTKVADMMPPETFKAITNPYYFAGLHWKEKREILMKMAEAVTYQDIAKDRADFEQLLRDITGKTVDEFAKEIAVRISAINGELDGLPGRIEEVVSMTPITPDYEALKTEQADIEAKIKDLETALFDANQASQAASQASLDRSQKIAELQAEQQRVLTAARSAAWEQTRAANEAHHRAALELQQLVSAQALKAEALKEKRRQLAEANAVLQRQLDDTQKRRQALIDEWYRLNEMNYTGSETLICPLSKQPCGDPTACERHRTHYYELAEQFQANIDSQQAAITEQGKKLNADIESIQQQMQANADTIDELAREINDMAEDFKAQREKAKQAVDETPSQQPAEINGEDLPEWLELQQRIDAIKAEADNAPAPETADPQQILNQRASLTSRLDEVKRKLGLRIIIEQMGARKQELLKQQKNLIQERATLQQKEAVIAEMTAARMAEVERRVNAKFNLVRFEMFEPTATTGEEKPNCVCWIGGTRYQDANRAAQVNAGIDIINALCREHQATAPIFIDNAECVNEFIPTESQLILLKVTDGDLTIE